MRYALLIMMLLFSPDGLVQEMCAPIKASPKTDLGKELYGSYKSKGLHINSYPSWSGEEFYVVGKSKNNRYIYVISEVYWGQSCRVTRKLYVFDSNKLIVGFYSGLSEVPDIGDLSSLVPTQSLYFEGENYLWQSLK